MLTRPDMQSSSDAPRNAPALPSLAATPSSWALGHSSFRRAFSLMELMVSIGILVMIILAVGVVFSGASRSVGMSQATMEEMAGVRSIQQLLERDLQGLDHNGFLVIRCRVLNSSQANSPHFDQLSFLSQGTFANPTGADTPSPFTDGTMASAAHIWWGQLIMEKNNPPTSYVAPNQQAIYPQNQLPTGVNASESDFRLGRHVTLLVPGPANNGDRVLTAGQSVMAYPNIDGPNGTLIQGNDGNVPAHVSSSRFAVAAQTPAQVMQYVMAKRSAGVNCPEADLLTYRFRALASVYDTEVSSNPFVNGYFRTTPTVMSGVSSFRVDWTDGTTNGGQLVWFGAGNANGNSVFGERVSTGNGDDYDATFSYLNKAYWPKALKITMHVANDRIGGRDFVQVINLP